MRSLKVFLFLLTFVSTDPLHAMNFPFGSVYPILSPLDGAATIAIADFDQDGKDDVAMAGIDCDSVVIRYNTTPATWATLTTTFDQAVTLATADIDGDGWVDLIAGKRGSGDDSVRWYRNLGGGSVWQEILISGTEISGVRGVIAGDMDNDGDVDIVSASYTATNEGFVVVWENTAGDGTSWTSNEIDDDAWGAHTVRLGDINRDGRLDIVVAAYHFDTIGWYLNGGLGTLWAFRLVGGLSNPLGLDLTDMDGDGDLDVVAGAYGDGEIVWLRNLVDYSQPWEEVNIATGIGGVYEIEVADLDQDGDPDILTGARTDDEILWLENRSDSWTQHIVASSFDGARSARAADLDGDGDLDVVAAAEFADAVSWRENISLPWVASFPSVEGHGAAPGTLRFLATGDLDWDGDLDLVGAVFNETGDADIVYWEKNTGVWSTANEIDNDLNGAEKLRLADLNQDGNLDIVAIASNADMIVWYEYIFDGSYTRHTVTTGFDGAIDVDLGDFDCDGDLDIVAVAYLDGLVKFWENTDGNAGVWSYQGSISISTPSSIRTIDIDHQNGADLVVASFGGDKVSSTLNLGCGFTFSTMTDVTGFDGPGDLVTGDFNRDGWMDLGVAAPNEGTLDVIANENGSAWTVHPVANSLGDIQTLAAADMDKDGDLDLIATIASAGDVLWWNNQGGTGDTWATMTPVTEISTGVDSLIVADFEVNGLKDVISAGDNVVGFSLFPNRGGQYLLEPLNVAPSEIMDGERAAIFRIDALSTALAGDLEIELHRIDFRFFDNQLDLFVDAEANALFDSVEIWFDTDSDGSLDTAVDTLLAVESILGASMNITVPSGDPNPAIAFEDELTFFATVILEPDASAQTLNSFYILLEPTQNLAMNYRATPSMFPASIQWADKYCGPIQAISGHIFSDGFESNDVSEWSSSVEP